MFSPARSGGSMPFFYDETNIEWPADDSEPPPPRPDQFVYMTVAEYWGEPAGTHAPARFSLSPLSAEEAAPVQGQRSGILARLFGWESAEATSKRIDAGMRRSMLLQRQRTQQLFLTMVPALRSLGVRRAYCRYDGGNDEGFSWLDHFETDFGERIDVDPLVKRLHDMGIHDTLRATGFKDDLKGGSADQKIAEIKRFACSRLIDEWSWVLLGSYGAGEYSMYGAFTVDLAECTVSDDSSAQPIVKHITIAS